MRTFHRKDDGSHTSKVGQGVDSARAPKRYENVENVQAKLSVLLD
jgi:hypothetical protein